MALRTKKILAGIAALAALALGGAALAQAGGGSDQSAPATTPATTGGLQNDQAGPRNDANEASDANEAEDRDEPGDSDRAGDEGADDH